MQLAQRLKAIRTRKNMSQKEVALSVGIDRGQYSRFENGKAEPSLATLRKIALALEVKIGDLFEQDDAFDVNIYDQSLVEKVRMLDSLDAKQKEVVYGVMETMLTNKKLKDTLANLLKDVA